MTRFDTFRQELRSLVERHGVKLIEDNQGHIGVVDSGNPRWWAWDNTGDLAPWDSDLLSEAKQ